MDSRFGAYDTGRKGKFLANGKRVIGFTYARIRTVDSYPIGKKGSSQAGYYGRLKG